MPFARTVLGDVDVTSLGVTNAHEHLTITGGLITVQYPDYRLDDTDKAIAEVQSFRQAGGNTIVEATPCGLGRDPEALRKIAQVTGTHVIASTGVHKESYYLDTHWRFHYGIEDLARLWQAEVEEGLELSGYEGPLINRSAARAGVLKVGSDYQHINGPTRRCMEAAVEVHRRTGVPILTHSEMGTMMLEQVSLFEQYGLAPSHLVISHGDRNPDLSLHIDVAQSGAFIEYDGPGRVKYFPESTIIALIRGMFEAGLGGQIVIGGDNARRSYWKSYNGGPGIAYTVGSFLPRLRREGFSEAETSMLYEGNPQRVLAFAE